MMLFWMVAFVVQTYWRKKSIRLRLLFFSYQELAAIRIIKPRSNFTLLPVYTSVSTGLQRRVNWIGIKLIFYCFHYRIILIHNLGY